MNSSEWNKTSKTQREKLLIKAGHSKNLKYRSFDFLPKNVLHDLDYIEKRQNFSQTLKTAAVL